MEFGRFTGIYHTSHDPETKARGVDCHFREGTSHDLNRGIVVGFSEKVVHRMQELPAHKVVMLGDASVGKTSIVLRFIEGVFRRMTTPTVGSGTSTKDVSTSVGPIRLTIWDTAGEERYRSFTGLYSQGAVAAVIVFDLTDEPTFDALPTWVDLFKQAADSGHFIIIIGNKLDLEDRAVPTSKAREWSDQNEFKYFEVSAKTGENIDLVFAEVAESIAHSGQSGPISGVVQATGDGSGCC